MAQTQMILVMNGGYHHWLMIALANVDFDHLTSVIFFRKGSSVDGSDPMMVAVSVAVMVDFVLVVLYPQTHTIPLATSLLWFDDAVL
jgi:hypothetical protein